MKCADCGVELVQHRGRWAQVIKPGREWSFTCRLEHNGSEDQPRLVSADYHYIEGEVQMHWPPTVDSFRSEGANNNNPQKEE